LTGDLGLWQAIGANAFERLFCRTAPTAAGRSLKRLRCPEGSAAKPSIEGGIMSALMAKIFSDCTTNITSPGELQINDWLAEHPDIEIVQMLQSESMVTHENRIERNLTITLIYREPSA
jgi:hypothetical protein